MAPTRSRMYPNPDWDNTKQRQWFADFVSRPADAPMSRMKWPVENLESTIFNHNHGEIIAPEDDVDGMIAVRTELSTVPLGGEVDAPIFKYANDWQQYLTRDVFAWEKYFSSYLMIHFYRRVTADEFQSPTHMRFIYAMGAVSEWFIANSMLSDDQFDQCVVRTHMFGPVPSWTYLYPISTINDCCVLREFLNLVLRRLCKQLKHPLAKLIIHQMDDFTRRTAYHFAHASWLECMRRGTPIGTSLADMPKGAGVLETGKSHVPWQMADYSIYFALNWYRVEQYAVWMIDTSRAWACYKSIPLVRMRAVVSRLSWFYAALDDVAGFDQDGVLEDILSGEMHFTALTTIISALDDYRQAGDEAAVAEITSVMNKLWGTWNRADAEAMRDMMRKFDIDKRMVELTHFFQKWWLDLAEEEERKMNMPVDSFKIAMKNMYIAQRRGADHSHLGLKLTLEVEPHQVPRRRAGK